MFLIIGLICFFASCLGTISGFGISAIMIPLFLLFFPYREALFVVGIIHWANSMWKMFLFRKGISWQLVFYFGMPAMIASVIGALFVSESTQVLMPLLGIFLIAYSLFVFFKPTFSLPTTNKNLLLGGSLSGFSAGIFGIRGAIRSMFLSAYNLPKKVYLGTTGVISFIVDTTRVSIYLREGIPLDTLLTWEMSLWVILSFVGAYVGSIIVAYIPQQIFRTIIMAFLLLLGIQLIIVSMT